MDQGVGPEYKPQYHKKNIKRNKYEGEILIFISELCIREIKVGKIWRKRNKRKFRNEPV
jgi:hypothetical protein